MGFSVPFDQQEPAASRSGPTRYEIQEQVAIAQNSRSRNQRFSAIAWLLTYLNDCEKRDLTPHSDAVKWLHTQPDSIRQLRQPFFGRFGNPRILKSATEAILCSSSSSGRRQDGNLRFALIAVEVELLMRNHEVAGYDSRSPRLRGAASAYDVVASHHQISTSTAREMHAAAKSSTRTGQETGRSSARNPPYPKLNLFDNETPDEDLIELHRFVTSVYQQ